jgi:acetolactate synthase-1/2/3 large subunit
VNFPSSHPAYLTNAAQVGECVAQADVVLVADAPVPWIPAHGGPAQSATVISLELDPAQASMPYWSFPVDLALQCDPVRGLQALAAALTPLVPQTPVRPWVERLPAAVPAANPDLMNAADVGRVIDGLISQDDIVIEEATTNAELLRGSLARDVPETYYRAGGSGLGWGLGAGMGVALAAPGKRVITIVGDGAFVFGVPTAALTAMAAAEVATVIVVLRNGGYAASRAPVIRLFPDGRSVADDEVTGTLFATNPDFATLARACGAHGAYARTPEELEKEFAAALDRTADGVSSVIVVPVSSPWIPTDVSASTGKHA